MRRGPRGNSSSKAATQGEGGGGREAARSAAGDADDAQGIFWRFFKPEFPQIDVDSAEARALGSL
ncbi:hypothetical protein EV715DRAFT_298315 [Schizophyllum commune]